MYLWNYKVRGFHLYYTKHTHCYMLQHYRCLEYERVHNILYPDFKAWWKLFLLFTRMPWPGQQGCEAGYILRMFS